MQIHKQREMNGSAVLLATNLLPREAVGVQQSGSESVTSMGTEECTWHGHFRQQKGLVLEEYALCTCVSLSSKEAGEVSKWRFMVCSLFQIPIPSVPAFQPSTPIPERLEAVQRYIRELQYNHTGTQFFEIKKSRPLTGLMDLAKEMTKEALPIKCLEAVILGIYLTNNMTTLDRFPISFKTHFSGNYFRHIVLGVNFGGRYGALGISRREELMYKAPVFRTLSELIFDFEEAYRRCWHTLKKVKLGHCVSHDPHSVEQIEWKHSILDLDKLSREDFRKELERHARDMRLKIGKGTGPPSPTKDRKKDVSSPQRGQASPHRRNSRGDRRPSGEKKPADSKAMPDLNGYQIRV
uniref:Vasohibin 1 n=1 Tax=Meleagris gallopavo TaxID=9103 RepID=A0A803XR78_MELGA